MKKLIYLFVFLCCTNSLFALEPSPNSFVINISHDLRMESLTKQEDNQQEKYSIKLTYPQLTGSSLTPAADRFNADIKEFIETEITEFKSKVADGANEGENIPAAVDKNTFDLTFQAGVFNIANSKIISVRFNKEFEFAGNVHPIHDIEVYNYDLTAGKKLELSEFFKPGSNYLKILSEISYKQLTKHFKNADAQVMEKGTAPKIENFVNWMLEPDGILLIFDEYQVASYVDGQPEVFIPYKDLAKEVLPKALIQICIKNPKECSAV